MKEGFFREYALAAWVVAVERAQLTRWRVPVSVPIAYPAERNA